MAVMATAVNRGRKDALVFALGVVTGSAIWGVTAALGLSMVLARTAGALILIKILGGLYLLWLAFKSARPAIASGNKSCVDIAASGAGIGLFLRGAAMHLTNPKAIFVWLSLFTLTMPPGAGRPDAMLVVAGCVLIGTTVFCGYALLLSTRTARLAYLRLRRWIDGALAALFGYAGLRVLLARLTCQSDSFTDGDAVEFYCSLGFVRAGRTQSMWIYAGSEH